MSGFTPAPWGIVCAGQDDMTNAECVAEEMPVVSIGPILYCEFGIGLLQDIQREYEDARLVAAAPELYNALAFLCAEINNRSKREHLEKCVGLAESVLAKASGEEEG